VNNNRWGIPDFTVPSPARMYDYFLGGKDHFEADRSPDNVLYAVSCARFSYCVAVGQSFNGSADQTLVEVWNGATWSMSPSADPGGAIDSHLYAVSCVSSSYCVAVGTSSTGSANQMLAEGWNGTAWSITPVANPGGATQSGQGLTWRARRSGPHPLAGYT
jgi:S-adenosyl methyltransferase